jgi:photosystem II stability/assembly factor-like uncharacterized protein
MKWRCLWLLCILALAAPAFAAAPVADRGAFTVTGMGGAGGMFTPTVSPYDPSLMLLSCDMSGAYRSTDAGAHWQLIHYKFLSSARAARPAFTAKGIYWAGGDVGLRVSLDKGATWQAAIVGAAPWKGEIRHLAAVDRDPAVLLVGTDKGVWMSDDAGKTWTGAAASPCDALLVLGSTVYQAVRAADARGSTVLALDVAKGPPWKALEIAATKDHPILALAGAGPRPGARRETLPTTLYAAVDQVGILKSPDGGMRWDVVMPWQKQNDILMPSGQTEVAYAAQDNGREVWRTADGGRTWTSIFHMTGDRKNVELSWVQTVLRWDYTIMHLGLGIDPSNPDTVLVSTQGDFYRSKDGGRSWQPMMNQPVGVLPGDPAFRYKSIGLEVTSVWNYVFDPWDANRRYICYTDIGFARSVDGGQTWISATRGCPWGNTYYEIAFDPAVKGRLYAACSIRHDIPHWTHVDANRPGQEGGLCVSDDFGASWRVLAPQLPKLPCTSVVIDPKSPPDKLTLYAAFFEGGVYKSADGGKTWAKKSEGLGNPGNLHVYRIRIHPKSGNVYGLITALRKGSAFDVPGGVWRSTDGGEAWADLTAGARLCWPNDFAVHPDDENTIYVAAATAPGKPQGGVWKTADGGKTWRHVLKDADLAEWCPPGYTHGMAVKLHPDHPDWVYFGSNSHGPWLSRDAGAMWQVFEKFPFRAVQNVTFDPKDHAVIHVSTFGGGAWTGGALPE